MRPLNRTSFIPSPNHARYGHFDILSPPAALIQGKPISFFSSSLHRHALCQIPRLVHIRPPCTRRVIRQQLQRHDVQDG